jgi:hypothetical protein
MKMDTLMDFLPYVAVAVIFYTIGKHVAAVKIMNNLVRDPDGMIAMIGKLKEIIDSEDKGIPEDAHEVKTEQVNGLIFAYDKHTGEFLAQADTLHSVMVLAAKRFPGKRFWHPELTKDHQTA